MPLRDDLLTPIAGENPAGADLYYDPVFSQIKEARREDEDDGTGGDWEVAQKKKADYRGVIKLAGDALAKRSKDLRLLTPLIEAQIRIEGYAVLAPCLALLHSMQEEFWPTLYPLPDDGVDFEMRMISVEAAAKGIMQAIVKAPLTRSGLSYEGYLESRAVGYEKDATSESKREARQDAIEHNKLTAEDFDEAFNSSPKALYANASNALTEALEELDKLNDYGNQAYPVESPNLGPLRQFLETLHLAVESLLNEKRKTDPDAVVAAEPAESEEGVDAEAEGQAGGPVASSTRPAQSGVPRPRASSGQLTQLDDAYAQVVESALFIQSRDPLSPVPYLICAGLRFGESRQQGDMPAPGFAVGPSSEVRQLLRNLANRSAWQELLRESLPVLASECARAWLDLHRYVWMAGQESGSEAIAGAVVGTVKAMIMARPELRNWTLEDDTGAANPETQRWLDSTVLY